MKKVIFLFAIALCGAVCLTSCSDDDNNAAAWYYYAMMNGAGNGAGDGAGDNDDADADVQVGLDTTSPDKIVLTYYMDMAGAGKAVVIMTATFEDGACTSYTTVTKLNGNVLSETDETASFEGMPYDVIKSAFETIYALYNDAE